ncbi:MAG TPA: TRAP transporter small permease subunit [Casimicrobiaceae bacterium]|nr:TRAP transporter small permease subunit [Casimicrobiaceae bacterium]
MDALLGFSRIVDALSERIGRVIAWLVLVTVLISAANATVRKIFDYSSNSFLEIQWYLFAAIFLIGAGYTLLRNEHVRIDIISARLSPRAQNWIDVIGIVLFLFPMSIIIMWLSWPLLQDSYVRHEVSTNAGGLIIWPARLLVPVGFFLLILQGVSELIKRIAFLAGRISNPLEKMRGKTAEEELAEEIARVRGLDDAVLRSTEMHQRPAPERDGDGGAPR